MHGFVKSSTTNSIIEFDHPNRPNAGGWTTTGPTAVAQGSSVIQTKQHPSKTGTPSSTNHQEPLSKTGKLSTGFSHTVEFSRSVTTTFQSVHPILDVAQTRFGSFHAFAGLRTLSPYCTCVPQNTRWKCQPQTATAGCFQYGFSPYCTCVPKNTRWKCQPQTATADGSRSGSGEVFNVFACKSPGCNESKDVTTGKHAPTCRCSWCRVKSMAVGKCLLANDSPLSRMSTSKRRVGQNADVGRRK